jgi:hypothetical protein
MGSLSDLINGIESFFNAEIEVDLELNSLDAEGN